jgi:hypothetical protein
VGVVVDVRLVPVLARHVLVRRVRVIDVRVVVLVPVGGEQVLDARARVHVVGDVGVLVAVDDRRMRV